MAPRRGAQCRVHGMVGVCGLFPWGVLGGQVGVLQWGSSKTRWARCDGPGQLRGLQGKAGAWLLRGAAETWLSACCATVLVAPALQETMGCLGS